MDRPTARGFGDDRTDGRKRAGTVGSSLDDLMGAWTTAEADEMDSFLEELETIDEMDWK